MQYNNFVHCIKRSAFGAFVVLVVVFAPANVSFAQTISTSAMSISEMSALVDSLLAMVESLMKQLAEITATNGATTPAIAVNTETAVSVAVPATPSVGALYATVESGSITPAEFRFLLSEQKSLFLNAADADYVFEIPESGINALVPQGAKVEIFLGGLGVGTHFFSCGADCTGSIVIESEDD